MNCLYDCQHNLMAYAPQPSAAGEINSPDVSRRGFLITFLAGAAAVPILRLEGQVGPNWNSGLIRPPGSLPEEAFLTRCLKCGQCMRICPTNIIQPALFEGGFEAIWTPVLNFRIGTSGCQLNCVACGQICPTSAIRPISFDEKLGRNQYTQTGPIRLGTAFVDRGRCLPWAMDKPCIVCQENCPVSPKAIFVREYFSTLRNGIFRVQTADAASAELEGSPLQPGRFGSGDYYAEIVGKTENQRRLIVDNGANALKITPDQPWTPPPLPGMVLAVQVRLRRPQEDPQRCIGCGVCEHECPVHGQRAIRITAENESRNPKHSMLLK